QYKPSSSTPSQLEETIREFMCRDDVSKLCPDKNKHINHHHIRYRLNHLTVLHQQFELETKIDIDYHTFRHYVPSFIIKPKVDDWGACLCINCLNPQLKFDKLHQLKSAKPILKQLLKSMSVDLNEVLNHQESTKQLKDALIISKKVSSVASMEDFIKQFSVEFDNLEHHLHRVHQQFKAAKQANSMHNNQMILQPYFIDEIQRSTTIKLFTYDKSDVDETKQQLPSSLKTVKGTGELHEIIAQPTGLIFGKKISDQEQQSLHDAAMNDDVEMNDLIIDKISKSNTNITDKIFETPSTTNNRDSHIDCSSNQIIRKSIDNQETPKASASCHLKSNTDGRHNLYRNSARVNYLKNQSKRQKLYDEHLKKIADSYKNGDLVGIAINRVDRTNCDPKIMPCIIEKRLSNTNNIIYSLISAYGRIATSFPVHQLIPMSCSKPLELQNVNFETVPTVSLVQASKMFARGNATATCDCKTKCIKKTCPCRRASVACSTKCHPKRGKCKNVEE
ncbi:unnamed protein product, partial [Rotaria magnacalcarata]